jgi:hypothetical protein
MSYGLSSGRRWGAQQAAGEASRKYVPGHPLKAFVGAHTKTDREPMSTPEYKGHIRRKK